MPGDQIGDVNWRELVKGHRLDRGHNAGCHKQVRALRRRFLSKLTPIQTALYDLADLCQTMLDLGLKI